MVRTRTAPRPSSRSKAASRSNISSRHKARTQSATGVLCWEDDPGAPDLKPALKPITVSAPDPSLAPLPFKLRKTAPPPKRYPPGSAEFLYYANACALRRAADFWGRVVPAGTTWQVGAVLPVSIDDGIDLNAFYTRGGFGDSPGLHFFHDRVGGRTYYSGESPDIACHELGHAVLDALQPALFDAQTVEAAAFHEAFGDVSALLSALQVPSLCRAVLEHTNGVLNRTSRLSRLAEQLGSAIRSQHPEAVEADCLRNACNAFFYRDPQTLPPAAPASQLSSEPHSFARVFTGAFLDTLAGVVKVHSAAPEVEDVVQAGDDLGVILTAAVRRASLVPEYFAQVAAEMVRAGEAAPFGGKYRDVLKSAFVRRGILSLQAAAALGTTASGVSARRLAAEATARVAELPIATISAAAFGLKRPTVGVHAANEPRKLAVTASALTGGPTVTRSSQQAAEAFTEDLFQRGRVDAGAFVDRRSGIVNRMPFKTHAIVDMSGLLVVKRRTFDCGFDAP